MSSVALVEGESDRAAVLVAARRLGVELQPERVIAMGGITNLRAHAVPGACGLYDGAEQRVVERMLAITGRDALAGAGFFACDADLEWEFIRAIGEEGMLDALDRLGDLSGFRGFQGQVAQRGRPMDAQLHRFIGTRGGRKLAYATALSDAVAIERMPPPLVALVTRLRDRSGTVAR